MKYVRDTLHGFRERPHYEPAELDSMFEKIVVDFLRQKHGKAEFPITTEDITVLIERDVSDLDQYADLTSYGSNVEGVTEFVRSGTPKVSPAAIDIESGAVGIETLKRRKRGIVRQVPLPPDLLRELEREFNLSKAQHDPDLANVRIWRMSRTTAWRRIKTVMLRAKIVGSQASPKGLRHAFGVHAIQSGVPVTLLQRWLGHASLKTTAIYLSIVGPEEHAFAQRMWSYEQPLRPEFCAQIFHATGSSWTISHASG